MGTLDGLTLHMSPTSPFARRVRVALRRLSLAYEEVAQESLWSAPEAFLAVNPLGLVPALVPRGQEPVLDSSVILDFLDDHSGGVWPKELMERWAAKRVSTLATGVMTDAVAWRVERGRIDPRKDVLAAKEAAILRTLAQFAGLDRKRSQWWRKPNQALFDVGIALEYLAFRLPHLESVVERVLEGADEALWNRLDDEDAFVTTRPPGLAVQG